MATRFKVIALSSVDPFGEDRRDEPTLLYPDALKTAQALKAQGKAFRVFADGVSTDDQWRAFHELGSVE